MNILGLVRAQDDDAERGLLAFDSFGGDRQGHPPGRLQADQSQATQESSQEEPPYAQTQSLFVR